MPATTKPRTGRRIPPRPAEPIDAIGVYTYDQAAAHLQMTAREVRDMVGDGRIGHVAMNRRQRRVLGRQIMEFIARRERGATR